MSDKSIGHEQVGEIAQRILAELEEQGWDDLHSILNTVICPQGTVEEIGQLRSAILEILEADFGYLTLEFFHPRKPERLTRIEAIDLLNDLAPWFRFDGKTGYWGLGNGDPLKSRFPVLNLTSEGIDRSLQILELRGYQWWKRAESNDN